MKTYSPKQLSLFISLVLSVLGALFIFLNLVLHARLLTLVITVFLFFGLTYISVRYILNRFIYDKIKPLYKAIRDVPVQEKKHLKTSSPEGNIITDVQKEVEEWAKNKTDEIARLRDIERYRKEFVGNVSHELKTPIFNIQGYILTLLEGGIDDPNINKLYLKRTEKSIDRMISIVEDLESITKLEAGELKPNYVKFDIVKLTEDAFELEQPLAHLQKISLEFNPRPDKPVMVRADKKRIMEVMTNLIVNGIKYGKKKGFVKVAFYDLHDLVMVEVADNGIGIAKNDLPRVFERFYRVDKSRSREQGGTGLGLSIVKHIIEAHGQTINVKSVIEEGTTFTFTLEKAR
ncbi:MAG: ATP-binding protein [Prolixibacteraceae bacterium]|jgi:two-component system phosphate regulon sensor histidine kinase PhoR|nr:ATP-binding protein [Prolixibacteraceae bacterium]